MRVDLFILQICEFLDYGDGLYRFHAPSRALSRAPGVGVVDCDAAHRRMPELAEAADVLILAAFDWDFFPLLERRRAAGRVTIFEANDYYDDIQPWNPRSARWLDRGLRSSFNHGLVHADAVQTSTPELVRRWKARTSRPVRAFANQLTEVPALQPPPQRPLTIGWGGSPGHFADWYALAPYLEEWLNAHPDAHLAVMNDERAKRFIDLPAARYHYEPFGTLAQYQAFLKRLDIGLAPLLPSDYNRCRSEVKFLEYASHGVAGIYADLEPYRDVVVEGETGLFYRTPAEFMSALDRLAADHVLRERIRAQAHAYVSANRRLEQHLGERLAYYRELLPGGPRGCTFSGELLAEAVCDGRYLQLRAAEPERILERARSVPRPADSVGQLRDLVSRFPGYLLAQQQLGQQLNDRGENAAALEALEALERARLLRPDSARTLAEMGRAHFALKQNDSARSLLEEALAANPYYLAAWQYLLRLLELTKAADGREWAERACARHPDHYALALLGLRMYPKAEVAARFSALLERFAPLLTPEERPLAAAAFSETIRDLYGLVPSTGELLNALALGCAAFPDSALLAHLYGHALRKAGRVAEGYVQHTRALDLHRIAQTHRMEFPKDEGTSDFWAFAEHIGRYSR